MSALSSSTSVPIISAIVAMAENRVIGYNNQLPWYLPADLKHFKAITTGNPILMGRKTHQSIGKPLPNRTNIVLTRDKNFHALGCSTATSIDEAIKIASTCAESKEIFIIGGAEIYKQLFPLIQRVYLTIVHHIFDGDAYFPSLQKKDWQEIECVSYLADKENAYSYSFLVMERIQQ